MTLVANRRAANDSLHDLMVLLIHDLELARPEGNEFFDPGLGGVPVQGGLKPNR
jgi:hypothetical protein